MSWKKSKATSNTFIYAYIYYISIYTSLTCACLFKEGTHLRNFRWWQAFCIHQQWWAGIHNLRRPILLALPSYLNEVQKVRFFLSNRTNTNILTESTLLLLQRLQQEQGPPTSDRRKILSKKWSVRYAFFQLVVCLDSCFQTIKFFVQVAWQCYDIVNRPNHPYIINLTA